MTTIEWTDKTDIIAEGADTPEALLKALEEIRDAGRSGDDRRLDDMVAYLGEALDGGLLGRHHTRRLVVLRERVERAVEAIGTAWADIRKAADEVDAIANEPRRQTTSIFRAGQPPGNMK